VEHKRRGVLRESWQSEKSYRHRLIEELYAASAAGVPITLIVRGVCCLRPGVPELSENIQVASIVGRFWSTADISVFQWRRRREYLGSADLMHRNLNRRVEVLFPIEEQQLPQSSASGNPRNGLAITQ